jgi:hypothetical protein
MKIKTNLMKAVTWFTVRTKATCSRARVGEGSLAETAMVLQSLTVFPAEEQAVHHTERGTIEVE